jgi:hypothetical protein
MGRRASATSAHHERRVEGVLKLVMNDVAGLQDRRQIGDIRHWDDWHWICPALQRHAARLQAGVASSFWALGPQLPPLDTECGLGGTVLVWDTAGAWVCSQHHRSWPHGDSDVQDLARCHFWVTRHCKGCQRAASGLGKFGA